VKEFFVNRTVYKVSFNVEKGMHSMVDILTFKPRQTLCNWTAHAMSALVMWLVQYRYWWCACSTFSFTW